MLQFRARCRRTKVEVRLLIMAHFIVDYEILGMPIRPL
jgi:hypothetical protein